MLSGLFTSGNLGAQGEFLYKVLKILYIYKVSSIVNKILDIEDAKFYFY